MTAIINLFIKREKPLPMLKPNPYGDLSIPSEKNDKYI
jgi:hypothetical protein